MASLRYQCEPPFGAGSLALSLGLHLVLVAFVLVAGWHKAQVAPPILEVSLVAPPPGNQAAAPGKARSGGSAPEIKPKVSKPRVALKTAPKAIVPPVKKILTWVEPPSPLALAPPSPSSRPMPVDSAHNRGASAPQGSGAAANPGSAGGSGVGIGGGPGNGGKGQGTAGGGPGALAAVQTQYLSLVRARILAFRQYPPLARARHMEGVVRLRFILTHSGALSQGVQIVKPSGFSVLDEQASQCVLAAAPFPPFPPDLRRDSLTVEVPIVYRLKDFSG